MRITASIVTYRTDTEELRRVLSLLSDSEAGRIYVVDNAAEPRICRICADYSRVVYIPSDNCGYGAGHNQALRLALDMGVSYHLVMNSDLSFAPEALSQIADFMDAHPDTGAVQPRIVSRDGSLQYTVRRLPSPVDLIGRRFIPGWTRTRRNRRYEMQDKNHDKSFEAPVLQGSFMFMSCEALRHVGVFDERFFMYPEDIDLSRRINEAYRTLYIPEPEIVHDHRRASYGSMRMLAIHCMNMIRYFNKWGWLSDPGRRKENVE